MSHRRRPKNCCRKCKQSKNEIFADSRERCMLLNKVRSTAILQSYKNRVACFLASKDHYFSDSAMQAECFKNHFPIKFYISI